MASERGVAGDGDAGGSGGDGCGSGGEKIREQLRTLRVKPYEEDFALKQLLEVYVERIQDTNTELRKAALENLSQEIRAATSSMTIPLALKFLRCHYGTLEACYQTMEESDLKKGLADILSVLAMSAEGERESLKYRLLGSDVDICSWGDDYVRNLATEIAQAYAEGEVGPNCEEATHKLGKQIVAFYMKNNSEPEAIDLLLEMEDIDSLDDDYVDKTNFKRTCLYLTSLVRYIPDGFDYPDDIDNPLLRKAFLIYLFFKEYISALRIALFMGDMLAISMIFDRIEDMQEMKQFSFILARQGICFELFKDLIADESRWDTDLQWIINNNRLSEGYLTLAHDIEVMEPKWPEDIYKAPMYEGVAATGASLDSAKLAATFVNAFVHAGFGQDKLMANTSESESDISKDYWLTSIEKHGKTSAVASLGMIFLWDPCSLCKQIGKYINYNDNYVVAGALLGIGIASCGVRHPLYPASELLSQKTDDQDSSIQIGAIMGLGIAYAGSQNAELRRKLSTILREVRGPLDVIAFAAISLGLIFVGSCDKEVEGAIKHALTVWSGYECRSPLTQLLPLGIGLLYLGKQGRVSKARIDSQNFKEKDEEYCAITLLSCAYAGTGNVLNFQSLLNHCSRYLDKDDMHQGPAVLGMAMIAMTDELNSDMAIRSLEHFLQHGKHSIRKAVPLALGLLSISSPKDSVMATLSRLSDDADSEVAMAAVISLGLMGAGTRNAQIDSRLRKLASYYKQDSSLLFCVRIAQGLVHLGKGLLTLNPYHSDRFLLSPTALAGLITMLHACLDMKAMLLREHHHVLYFLVLAMQPRMLLTVDKSLQPLSVPVWVGQAVDAEEAGRPETITNCQTHSTPVILASGYKAELATEKYIPLSPILEGFVILKENPEYSEDRTVVNV